MNDGGVATDDCGGERSYGHRSLREVSFFHHAEDVDISELGDHGLGIHDSGSRASGRHHDDAPDNGTSDSMSNNGPTLEHDDDSLLRDGYPRYYVGNGSDVSTNDNIGIGKYFSTTVGTSNDVSSSHSTSSEQRQFSRSAETSAVGLQCAIRAIAGQAHWLNSHFDSSSLQVVSGKQNIIFTCNMVYLLARNIFHLSFSFFRSH